MVDLWQGKGKFMSGEVWDMGVEIVVCRNL